MPCAMAASTDVNFVMRAGSARRLLCFKVVAWVANDGGTVAGIYQYIRRVCGDRSRQRGGQDNVEMMALNDESRGRFRLK